MSGFYIGKGCDVNRVVQGPAFAFYDIGTRWTDRSRSDLIVIWGSLEISR